MIVNANVVKIHHYQFITKLQYTIQNYHFKIFNQRENDSILQKNQLFTKTCLFKYNFLIYIKSKVYCDTCDDIYLKVKRLLLLSEIWTLITNLALQETTRVAKLAESKLRENTRKLQVPYMSTKSQKCCGMSLARANLCKKKKKNDDENSKIYCLHIFL